MNAGYPKKRMAVGAVLRDATQRVMIVKPTYRTDWLVPGGAVELDESPRVACEREIEEELGLRIVVGRLLCVDYRPAEAHKSESVHFIFDGGVLDAHYIERIVLPPDELERFVLLLPDQALPMLDVHLRRRMTHALVALLEGGMFYLEDGCVPR